MNDQQRVQFMANLFYVLYSDSNIRKAEEQVFNRFAMQISAKRHHLDLAVEKARAPSFELSFPFRFADSIFNLEAMLITVLIDKKLNINEKKSIQEAKQKLELSEAQFKHVVEDAKAYLLAKSV